jgi:cell division protein FtsI (penicillin-binding protein 3)
MAFALIGMRLVDIMMLQGRVVGPAGETEMRALPTRADLRDRNGVLLAGNLPVKTLYAQPAVFSDRIAAAHRLALATGTDEKRLTREFAGRHRYALVAQRLDPDAQDRVRRLGLPGLEFDPAEKRYYPRGTAAVQVLGSTDPDGNGVAGLERGLDGVLKAAQSGAAIALSLDMRVQFALSHAIEEARQIFGAKAGGGIVLDVRSGEILAMASLPDSESDPSALRGVDPRRNRMAQDDYELGSVFKIFSFALAIEDHTIRLDEQFPVGDGFRVGGFTIHDAEHMPAMLAARDILALSSNPGTAQIALRSGPARQHAFLSRIGLLAPLHSELPEARMPLVPRHWGEVETATVSYGHGISVTPLAFAAAAAAMVNGGRRITPTFLKHPADGRGEQLVSPSTSATIRKLLRYVVTNGSGRRAEVPGYDVGGKTGSAEKVVGRSYLDHHLITSFCGIFPIDNPRYLVFVMLDEPHGTKETFGVALAGYTAAPLAGNVIARIAPMLGVPPQIPIVSASNENP